MTSCARPSIASPIRPAALSRGPRMNPQWPARTSFPPRPLACTRPRSPGQALYPQHRALTHAVYGFFKNGGTRCFVARIKNNNAAELERALQAFESIDAVAIICAPGLDGKDAWGKLVEHCEKTEDRFAILDCPAEVETGDEKPDVKLLSYDVQEPALPAPIARYPSIAALVFLLLTLLVFFFPMVFQGKVFLPPDNIASQSHRPFIQEAFAAGEYPLWTPYLAMLESKIADINNAGATPFAGSITAALFLSRFVPAGIRWLHGDIYGWNPATRPGRPEGGEAQVARAIYRTIADRFGK